MSPSHYPARSRQQNISLIRGVIMARSEAEFDAARAAFSAALHPSLFSELDFMEESIPADRVAMARRDVDGLFDENLAALHRLRDGVPTDHAANGAGTLRDALWNLRDGRSVPLFIHVAVLNAVLFHLDDLDTRVRTKDWLRSAWNGQLPRLVVPESRDALHASVTAQVDALAVQAVEQQLEHVVAVLEVAQRYLATHDLTTLQGFDGEWAAGVGPCASCAMRFASTGLTIIDASTFPADDEVIDLPLFNMAECPFCGHVARLSMPVMFHWSPRAQVVYCVPLMPGQDEATALHESRPLFEHLRNSYRERLSPEEAASFDRASELVTYSVPQFLSAIQLGTTEPEWHAYNWVKLLDGTWLAVDLTKKARITFTEAEHAQLIAVSGHVGDAPEAARTHDRLESPPGGDIQSAMTAFKDGRFDVARQQLEALLAHSPGDAIVRRNLAVVYAKLGRMDDARRVLASTTPRDEAPLD